MLLEGTRDLPAADAPKLTALATHLARTFPHVRFRTGNAKGADEAFAAGVASIDPTRLEFVVPYANHRSNQRPENSLVMAIDDVPSTRMEDLVETTLQVSPQYKRVAVNYRKHKTHPRQRATAQVILRDTLKVVGADSLSQPVAGIFYVNASDADRGGTGHTMRVCRAQGLPVINQFHWLEWPFTVGESAGPPR